ncbi:MAG: three-Cys-motif partner protein TcmP [Deferribacteres bacterium]|nr:three-Cys-motif partner protein TcmP [Deferribacteres bacterium]
MAQKDVKTNLLNHSEAKVRLLGEYLKRYLNIICNDKYTRKIKIFDLFCGEGLYENGGEGSPLVILREVKDIHFANVAKLKSFSQIDCHFNDIEGTKIEKIKRVVEEKSLYYKEFGEIVFSSNDYQIEINSLFELLPKLQNEKAFIFIDPYEYKHIKASQIKRLMDTGITEVLLWLPTQFMYRFSFNGIPQALKDFIEELTQYKEWNKAESIWKFIDQLKIGFQNYMGMNYFVDTFTIQKDTNTVFCLFFFSSHIKGFEKMLEAKWEIDTEQGKGWNYTGNQPSLFHDTKTNPLEEKLRLFIKEKKRFNADVYEFTLRQSFLPKHTNEIFYNWQMMGILDVFLSDGTKARKRAYYIDYKYFRDDPEKVYYKLR